VLKNMLSGSSPFDVRDPAAMSDIFHSVERIQLVLIVAQV